VVIWLKNIFTFVLIFPLLLTACTNYKAENKLTTSSSTQQIDLEKIKLEAYEKAKADLQAQAEAEAKIKAEAEAKAKAESDAKVEAEEKAKKEAEAKAEESKNSESIVEEQTESKAEEQDKQDFEKQKAEILNNNPEISDFDKLGELIVMVNRKIDSTPIVGTLNVNQKANGIFRFLYVTVYNHAKKAQTIDSSMFSLVDEDGTTYEPDQTAAIYANVDNKILLEKLNPGTEVRGYIVFDMPPEVKFSNLKLRMKIGSKHVDLRFVKPKE